jgi:serine/threonine-protein kinase
MARVVQLRQRWVLGKQIGDRSAFGRVFLATAEDGTEGVVKLIPKQPGADRELLFEDLQGVQNVVPIIDQGENRTSLLIAMPRAERSLRSELESVGGRMTPERAVAVLSDIATALAALHGRVVHRDIKPENVLLLDGRWCLADFGIARYAEASTGPATRKGMFSAPYAAPERWRFEHATEATDVYSLGVVGHELLAGTPPFSGPDDDAFRRQHLTEVAPALTGVPPGLAGLLVRCMTKAPQSRPTAEQLLAQLARSLMAASPGAGRLQAAQEAAQRRAAEEEATRAAAASEEQRRAALFDSAKESLASVSRDLREAVLENAPNAQPATETQFEDWALRLGTATIGMDPPLPSDRGSWGPWRPVFDVIAYAWVGILIPEDRHGYAGRAHSLFYCDAKEEGVYRWYETAFMVMPLMSARTKMDPIAFPPGEKAGKALSRTIAEWQVAWPFTPIDQGEEAAFIERWLDWFGRAAEGQLSHPSSMPELPPAGTYRD